jgi:hypothetical protein
MYRNLSLGVDFISEKLQANRVWRKIRLTISPTKLKQKFAKNCLLLAERSSLFAKLYSPFAKKKLLIMFGRQIRAKMLMKSTPGEIPESDQCISGYCNAVS